MIRDEDVKFGDLFRWHAGGIYMFLGWPENEKHYEDGRAWSALIIEDNNHSLKGLVQQLTVGFQCRVGGTDGWVRFG